MRACWLGCVFIFFLASKLLWLAFCSFSAEYKFLPLACLISWLLKFFLANFFAQFSVRKQQQLTQHHHPNQPLLAYHLTRVGSQRESSSQMTYDQVELRSFLCQKTTPATLHLLLYFFISLARYMSLVLCRPLYILLSLFLLSISWFAFFLQDCKHQAGFWAIVWRFVACLVSVSFMRRFCGTLRDEWTIPLAKTLYIALLLCPFQCVCCH